MIIYKVSYKFEGDQDFRKSHVLAMTSGEYWAFSSFADFMFYCQVHDDKDVETLIIKIELKDAFIKIWSCVPNAEFDELLSRQTSLFLEME